MKYYLWIEVVIIILLLLSFRLESVIAAAIDCYIFICSNSLYQECSMGHYHENAENPSESTAIKFDAVPPPAAMNSSYDDNMQKTQPQNADGYSFKE